MHILLGLFINFFKQKLYMPSCDCTWRGGPHDMGPTITPWNGMTLSDD